jgi:hypothetical protein
MTERASLIGVSRAAISKVATDFCSANELPPSFYMRSEEAGESYRKARLQVVAASNGSVGNGESPVPARGRSV